MSPRHLLSIPNLDALCKTASRIFLGLDYDGTLVPIASCPEEARPTPDLYALLSQLGQTPRIEVAIISGRPLAELCTLLPVPGISYVGTHGLEMRTATGETRQLIPAGAFTTIMARLRRDISPIVASDPGFLLEDKRYALALHYRRAQPETSERGVAQFLAAVLGFQRKGVALEAIHGKKVVEVRPVGVSKGKAVQYLLSHESNTTLPLYLGDDATDEDAFRVVNDRGLTILVADSPQRTAARYYLRDPHEVFRFLSYLLSLRQITKTAN